MQIPHSRPTLPAAEEWAQVTGRLAPGWVADGPCGEAFAREAAGWLGGTGGIAVNSGTSALHLALLAVGVEPGSEVLVPAYCCAALLNAVRLAGATPVLVDAQQDGIHLCPEDARRRATSRTTAVVVVHLFGHPAPLAPFVDLGLPIVEDCAQSLGATEGGTLTGSLGAVAICSFYATKVITTGQGGLASAREPQYLAAVRDMLDYDNRDDGRPRVNYKMSELQAALGLWQLERLPAFLDRRRALARYYDQELEHAGVGLPEMGAPRETISRPQEMAPGTRLRVSTGPIFYRYVVRTRDADSLIGALQARGIEAKRPVYRPLHHYLGGDYPHAQAAHEQLVSLPLYPTLADAEAEHVVAAVRDTGPSGRSLWEVQCELSRTAD